MIYEFDACVLDTSLQQLWRDREPVHVEPQVLAVLEHLAANNDRVITKIELLDEVWGDRFVSESALTSRIKLARKACGDNGREQRIVKTVHSRGYRFVAEVRTGSEQTSTPGAEWNPISAYSTPSVNSRWLSPIWYSTPSIEWRPPGWPRCQPSSTTLSQNGWSDAFSARPLPACYARGRTHSRPCPATTLFYCSSKTSSGPTI